MHQYLKFNKANSKTICFIIGASILIIMLGCLTDIEVVRPAADDELPYPHSDVVMSVEFLWETHKRLAPGSDNWPITWAYDGEQYAPWGDGGGFNGTNQDGRVSLGVARIQGDAGTYKGINIWGGKNARHPSSFQGKSYGILSLNQSLYMWASPDDGVTCYFDLKLYRSEDHGATWQQSKWKIPKEKGLITPTFLQFGQDYSGAKDDYVYIYAINVINREQLAVHKPGEISLLRVHKDDLMSLDQYEYFKGTNIEGQPVWTSNIDERTPVFSDGNGVGWNCSVSYNAKLGRYFLITEHGRTKAGNIGIFEAEKPWGPWKVCLYAENFGVPHIEGTTFFWNFSNKWTDALPNNEFVIVFTGINTNDSFNTVKGKFIISNICP
jgi:hypothetical protein